jgi:hypothetical protein
VLSDPNQGKAFRESAHWNSPLMQFQLRIKQEENAPGPAGGPAYLSNSLSGNERNRLLMQTRKGDFSDLSLLSGVDCLEDARSFAVLDYDSDGWLDIALMGPHTPRFRLFRNRMSELMDAGGTVTELVLEGANHGDLAGKGSNRDAVGATIRVTTSTGQRLYRKSIGEGLSTQNMRAIRIVLAPDEALQEIEIAWPSGKTQTLLSGFQRKMKVSEE